MPENPRLFPLRYIVLLALLAVLVTGGGLMPAGKSFAWWKNLLGGDSDRSRIR